eukprot:4811686-Amphidinium_carterae.1
MAGPSSFLVWSECFTVFRTGCIMLGHITPARLDAYKEHVRLHHDRYGATCWSLIYQADCRA